ncbi:MAG: hypothetical protein AAB462_01715 [Patescibacteria group bacterium]
MSILPKILPRSEEERYAERERALLRREAKLGGQLFGPVPKGHRREFFCLDARTWIWHEESHINGEHKVISTRYEFRPNGVIKLQDGHPYQALSKQEARNLYRATQLYEQVVSADYQRLLQAVA